MANPYQSPETESELLLRPQEEKSGLGAKITGTLAIVLGVLIAAYGVLILGIAVFTWKSISNTSVGPEVVLLLGLLIFAFGAGLALGGVGLWAKRKRWSRAGGLTAVSAFALYVAIVIAWI